MARIVTDYLEEIVHKTPNKIAFVDDKRSITFEKLRGEALHIASAIIQYGLSKKPIAIYLDKGISCISAFLGVAYSANFYTMIDTSMPNQRVEKILSTLEPQLVITDAMNQKKVEELVNSERIITIEEAFSQNANETEILSITGSVIETDVLYVLFTSGSTGVPKGVITSNRAVVSYLEAVTEAYQMDAETIIGNQAPFYFVLSLIDIYCTIKNGGTTYIIPHEYFTFPGKLVRYIEEKKITFLNWVSSALSVVASLKALNKADISCVKTVIFGGEIMPIKHLNAWMSALPNTVFINGYGSTEVTDSATYYIVNRKFNDNDLLPLGVPLSNTSILVLNEKNEPAKPDETGELFVRGSNLSYGYYNDLERTNAVFIQNPLNSAYKEIVYKTGDIVRYNEFGEIEYVGRKDYQIKHMGHRIELGEIEVNICSIDGVDECCCVYDSDSKKIILFFTGTIEDENLSSSLKLMLPVYMLPNKRIKLEVMPHNLNGKIDRAKLKTIV